MSDPKEAIKPFTRDTERELEPSELELVAAAGAGRTETCQLDPVG